MTSPADDAPELFVKICGITSEADALLAVGMGASAVGFIFAPSPRQMAPAAVADIVKRLPHETVTVGVFRDESTTPSASRQSKSSPEPGLGPSTMSVRAP